MDFSTRKSDMHQGSKAQVYITFKGRQILMSNKIEVNNFFAI